MQKKNILAETIDAAAERAKYDECAKKLIAQKVILAWILKGCTEEFSSYSIEYIMDECIEGKPDVAQRAVHQDQLDIGGNEMIIGMNTEDNSIKEHKVTYDIKFSACVPGTDNVVELIINVEIQLDDVPGYPLVKRGLYYCSRMISAQYGSVFTEEHYEKLQKVYSIWICPDPANKRKNSIRDYGVEEKVVLGESGEERMNYDLMEVVILNLGDANQKSDKEIINLLNVLLSSKETPDNKKRILHDEYHIAMTVELESEVLNMCNLSQAVWDKGMEQGMAQGVTQVAEAMLRDKEPLDKIKKYTGLSVDKLKELAQALGVTIVQ